MLTSTAAAAMTALLVATMGCGGGGASTPSLSNAPAPASPRPPLEWRIEPGRVGAIELGRPVPEVLVTGDLEAHYVARYIADAQPLDGLRFDDPPLTLVLASGPFAALDRQGFQGDPPVDQLRADAAAAVRGGVPVDRVMIHGRGPTTATGAGVGSTLAELEAGYPDLRLTQIPETLGDDTCIALSAANDGMSFVFGSCDRAKAGEPVSRVDLWIP